MTNMQKEKDWLLQSDHLEFITQELSRQQWVPAFWQKKTDMEHIMFYCALVPNADVPRSLEHSSWDMSSSSEGRPGCVQYWEDGKEQTDYLRYGRTDGIEPLIITREFYGIRPDYHEIAEEFRLYHDLYHDRQTDAYWKILHNGEEEEVIRVKKNHPSEHLIEIKLKYIKQFLAMKEMHLAVFYDLRRWSDVPFASFDIKEQDAEHRDETTRYTLITTNWKERWSSVSYDRESFSRLVGKKLIGGYSREKSGIWPFDREKEYLDFIIGSKDGEPLYHTCNPDELSNYFGANPGAPHYLTPVFFRREVLQRYYAKPSIYTVRDGHLDCGHLWGIEIDNNHPKYVLVYLGDLGRDLATEEQKHWARYHVEPDGAISRVSFKRDFLAEFADPQRADLLFKYLFTSQQKKWKEKHGWDLFLPLHEDDEHCLSALRIPLTDDQVEFDQQILALAKVLIDSLNIDELRSHVTAQGKEEMKGITLLEQLLKEKKIEAYENCIVFLRSVQSLRSTGVAHRKGENFEKAATEIGLETNSRQAIVEALLQQGVSFMKLLDTVAH